MRWADSDSDSEEEYVPPSSSPPPPEPEEELFQPPSQAPQYQHHSQPRDQYGGGRGSGGRGYHQSPKFERGRSGRGGGRDGGGGVGRGKNTHQQPRDWKEMAKASSRFANSQAPVDGSSWMAQRRAKMEQEALQHKEEQEKRLQQEQAEKHERRKSQLGALKAALKEIKESEPPPQTSPGNSLRDSRKAATKDTKEASPRQILTRKKPTDEQGNHETGGSSIAESEKPLSWRKHKKQPTHTSSIDNPPKYSYTIGQSPVTQPHPKAQLQPDGATKCVPPSSLSSVDKKNANRADEQAQNLKTDAQNGNGPDVSQIGSKKGKNHNEKSEDKSHIIEFDTKYHPPLNNKRGSTTDELSTTSRISRQSGRGRSGRRGGGRHHGQKHSSGRGGADDTSVSSLGNSSRVGGRGRGGRGRGRGRGGGRGRGDNPPPSKDLPNSNDSNRDSTAGRGSHGERDGAGGRGRGGAGNGGKGRTSVGRHNPKFKQKQGSTSPKPKYSYEIGAD
ncbi:hypothetical protein IV203_003268 [Nitzschia inconspicua]|uniref:Uncharacterized protein n=1 Tax=Nitzschia inconspicua TaxID=303405 RepID=A0A9K3L1T1_9STRA|nr:hypothetical protein IV203_003268 [Nitzschia inconspicua]